MLGPSVIMTIEIGVSSPLSLARGLRGHEMTPIFLGVQVPLSSASLSSQPVLPFGHKVPLLLPFVTAGVQLLCSTHRDPLASGLENCNSPSSGPARAAALELASFFFFFGRYS